MKQLIKRITKRFLIGIVASVILFFIADALFPVPADIEYAPIVLDKDGKVLHTYQTSDQQWRMKTELKEIMPELRNTIIYKEDKYFYKHPGINIPAIFRAVFNNSTKFRRTSGASTISMQVARLLEPKKRTYINKLCEMFRALQLELHYSKDEILQMYLNLVPYGSNIQGVKAASLLYFEKMPDQLSLAEITTLSMIPNRPNSLVIGKDNAYIVKKRNELLLRFKKDNLFPDHLINDAIQEPLNAYRHSAPVAVPQFAYRVRREHPGMNEIKTTISATVQLKAEDLVTSYMNGLKLLNINNASVIIIDNKTHEVRAYIGSSDFNDKPHHGEVDGVCAVRSPGSTLKPLLYGLSIDNGFITPKTVIADVPININGYVPENYDLQFRGNITVEDALKQSLNIPAVKLIDKLTPKVFTSSLINAGFTSVSQKRNKLGISMILGGCGVRLDELTALYASFSNGGKFIPIKYIKTNSTVLKQKGEKILSPESAYIITEILTELHRPDLPNLSEKSQNIPHIAWKTGTSYGRKDAWSIGYDKDYTVGVWIGNFDGTGVAGLNGAAIATPLLFQLFNSIDKNTAAEWNVAPEGIAFRSVCRQSGKIPSDFCTDQVMDYYIPGISPNERCNHMTEVNTSADEKYSYCTTCLPANGYKTKLYPNVSAELAAYYESSHISYQKIPLHNPKCNRVFDGKLPVITSLTNNLTYIIMDKQEQKLQLICATANDVQQVYWYVNDKFYASAKPGERTFFKPEGNAVKISCTDDKGRNADINIKLKYL
ncbi:MAG: penicillin-binding protein 1C [Bacteroidetes bacterium]|nr:penicillin-binding protein 1C [Bacteroidota bacterium]